MSYSSAPSRGLGGEDYLTQRFGRISVQNEYGDGMCSGPSSQTYDSQGEMMSGQWDYHAPEHKNTDTIVAELTPEEVRWFYKSDGEKRWLEFSGYDSYRTEMRYREMFFNKNDYGSKYSSYSAFSDPHSDPSGMGTRGMSGMAGQFGSIRFPSRQQQSSQQSGYGYSDQHQHKIVVRGGLYDVNFDTWKCASIYWPGEECQITRGTWFYEGSWQPLELDQSNTLEAKHLSMFKGRKQNEYVDNEAKGTPVHTETFAEFIVEWFSPGQVYLYSENKPSKIVRSVTSRLGFHKSTGYRLFRGYKTEATLDDRPDCEINHLVFVIHGIGQKMDTGRIIRNTSSLRDCVSWLKQKYFLNFPHHRAEFFPVEWRSNLQLDGELVDAITPNTLQSLRQMLNASAMDIMYYTSPLYGGEVQRGLREELNRLYSMFSARNPYFMNKGGKISVIAHSLGCVILYDIIMGLKPGSLVQNSQQGLLFQIQNFFCLGSPLAVFLALRWKDSQIPGKKNAILPPRLCHRLYNVFHPTDPVAYRIEPLLVKEYHRFAPLVIQPYNSTFHTPYGELPLEFLAPDQLPGQPSIQTGQKDESISGNPPLSPGRDRSWTIWGLMKGPRRSTDNSSLDSMQGGLEYRLDYILRESNLGVSYLSALTSHTAYWTNYDIAYFILTQIFPEFETTPGGIAGGPTADNPFPDKYNSFAHALDTSYTDPLGQRGFDDSHFRSATQNIPPQPQQIRHDYHPPRQDNFSSIQEPPFDDMQQQGFSQSYQDPHSQHTSYGPQSNQNFNQPFSGSQQGGPSLNLNQPFPGPSGQQYSSVSQQQQQHPQPPQQFQQSFQQHSQNNHQQMSQFSMNQQPHMVRPQQQQQLHQQAPHKTGFFDRQLDGKQTVSSPTKGTKSFFPSFNLSSLTSPVKNLSNSLSNISNQMTNLAKDGVTHTNMHPLQQQHPQQNRGSFLGGGPQMKQNYPNQPPGSFEPQYGGQNNQQYMGTNSGQGMQQQMHMNSPAMSAHQQHQMGARNVSQLQQQMGIRSSSPVSVQSRVSPLQYGPIETPTGTLKPKIQRIQPKIPGGYETKMSFAPLPPESQQMVGSRVGRCVSPLGQSKVVCSGMNTLPGSYNMGLGARSLSSGNLRNSTVVSGSYPGARTGVSFTSQAQYTTASSPTTSLSRRTMSRPNLSSSGSGFHSPSSTGMGIGMSSPSSTGLGMSSVLYSSNYGGKSFLSRDYSGPSSR